MSTFAALYPTARVCLGDIGTVARYSTTQLDLGIAAGLLLDDEFSEGEADVSGNRTITPDVADKDDTLRIAVRAAIALLSPQSGAFSYRTRSLSVTRGNAREGHLGYLEGLLWQIENSGTMGESETEWDQILRDLSEVTSALTGIG